jgi:hypothetical protein
MPALFDGYQTIFPTATGVRTGSTFASTYFAYAGGTIIGDWYAATGDGSTLATRFVLVSAPNKDTGSIRIWICAKEDCELCCY